MTPRPTPTSPTPPTIPHPTTTPRRLFRLGVLIWNQYTDWPVFRDIGARADKLGYDQLWTWDHLYPIFGSPDGPMLEGYIALTGWAAVTEHATLGLMVGANTFRNPGLVVKAITTLDHVSNGRAVLGIGWCVVRDGTYGLRHRLRDGHRRSTQNACLTMVAATHPDPRVAETPG